MVRVGRLELPHLTALDPKSSVSANSTTLAYFRSQTIKARLFPREPPQVEGLTGKRQAQNNYGVSDGD